MKIAEIHFPRVQGRKLQVEQTPYMWATAKMLNIKIQKRDYI